MITDLIEETVKDDEELVKQKFEEKIEPVIEKDEKPAEISQATTG